MKALASALLLIAIVSQASADSPDYWVTAQIDAFVRSSPTDSWKPRYSAPFGVRTGYGTGIILTDRTITDPKIPNCYSFTFMTKTGADEHSLGEEVEVTEYPGDNFCGLREGAQIIELAVMGITVEQGSTTTFEFPFLDGQTIRYELTQKWQLAPRVGEQSPM